MTFIFQFDWGIVIDCRVMHGNDSFRANTVALFFVYVVAAVRTCACGFDSAVDYKVFEL